MLATDLGKLAADIYEIKSRFQRRLKTAAGSWNGFQAGGYMLNGRLVAVFRGTATIGDGVSDLALGLGANTAYFAMGEDFVRWATAEFGMPVSAVCGHSLGGAIAQVVANRMNLPMVSFNAPGVAVVASKNIGDASPSAAAIRTVGMIAGAAVLPSQALRDVRAAFRPVRGLNIRLAGDPVSRIGVHYGNVRILPRSSIDEMVAQGIIDAALPLRKKLHQAHSMAVVNLVLERHQLFVPTDQEQNRTVG